MAVGIEQMAGPGRNADADRVARPLACKAVGLYRNFCTIGERNEEQGLGAEMFGELHAAFENDIAIAGRIQMFGADAQSATTTARGSATVGAGFLSGVLGPV